MRIRANVSWCFLWIFAGTWGCSKPTDSSFEATNHRESVNVDIVLPNEFRTTPPTADAESSPSILAGPSASVPVVPLDHDLYRYPPSDSQATAQSYSLPPQGQSSIGASQNNHSHFQSGATATSLAPALATKPPAEIAMAPPIPIEQPASPVVAKASKPTDYQNVTVYYATDRKASSLSLADFQLIGQRELVSKLGIGVGIAALLFLLSIALRRRSTAKLSLVCVAVLSIAAIAVFVSGEANIEKTGVTYTGERGKLERGVCQVTVPTSHKRGTIERPTLLKLEVNEDKAKHIVLTSVQPLDSDYFNEQLQKELSDAAHGDLLVFIHGYNVDFESAVHRTAQIAVDLPFQGVPVCYSWPSQGTLLGYPIDENNAAWTVGHLKEFLEDLIADSGADSIHVVAHSMGNRAMTSALQQIALKQDANTNVFDRVVLAAPDVDADLFRKDLAPALTQIAKQVTLYASSDDQALIASKQVHGYPRAGETGDHLVVVEGVDTIDVSGIDLSLLGHSYYGDSEPMLRDLFDVLLSRLPASQRSMLISKTHQSRNYWQLAKPNRVTATPSRSF